jgi:histidinol dehydrogenase
MSAPEGNLVLARLSAEEFGARPTRRVSPRAEETATAIIADVRHRGDEALRDCARRFDRCELGSIRLEGFPGGAERGRASKELLTALESSALRIKRFAEAQLKQFRDLDVEIEDGVILGQRVEAIASVGAYVPGGRYPLISSALMCVIPAKVAGVKRIAVMSPPRQDGSPDPMVVLAAQIAGADEFYVSGGAQAIAALAYGTQSVRPVDKIVGPGNAYVGAAKGLVAGDVGIDFYAGPSEVFVVADEGANPALVAADLAAQAEHDPEAQAVLISLSERLVAETEAQLEILARELPSGPVIRESIFRNGAAVIVASLDEAARLVALRAPEHLELHVQDARWAAPRFSRYGSLFIGQGAAEALGDYSAGLNHTLPTCGAARYASGLSVKDFICLRTSLETKPGRGKRLVAQDAATLAAAEGLSAHERAAKLRMRE